MKLMVEMHSWKMSAPCTPQLSMWPYWKPTEAKAKAFIDLDVLCTMPLQSSGHFFIQRGEVKMFLVNPFKSDGEFVVSRLFQICAAQFTAFSLYEFPPYRGCAYCFWNINNSFLHHHSLLVLISLYTCFVSMGPAYWVGDPDGKKTC